MGEKRPAKFYMDQNDALMHVGVTSKQLRRWREQGLIELEFGTRPGRELRFTERDLDLLEIIKRLHGEGYPTGTIKKMLSATDEPWGIDLNDWFWSYEREEWMDRWDIAHDALATSPVHLALPDLLEMALVAFLWRSARAGQSRGVRQTKVRDMFDAVLERDRDPDESGSCIHSALERTPKFSECVQYILQVESQRKVRRDPDGPRVLAELGDEIHLATGRSPHERTRLYNVQSCWNCRKNFVEEYAKNEQGGFCSEGCWQVHVGSTNTEMVRREEQ